MDSTPCLPSKVLLLLLFPFEKAEGFPLPSAICCCHSHIISGFPLLLQPVVVVLQLLDSQISCNIGLSSALLFSATPPLLTLFFYYFPPPTPTIEVVTDDKQIHLSNSICARSLLVHFPSQGYPQPEYRWMKDGSFQTEFSSEPVYKIQSIRREDAGVYQCVARNAVGSIFSEQVQVLVACTSQQYLRIAQTTIVFMNLFSLFLFSFSLMG